MRTRAKLKQNISTHIHTQRDAQQSQTENALCVSVCLIFGSKRKRSNIQRRQQQQRKIMVALLSVICVRCI